MTFTPQVSIIGAGPAGLLLARYLQIHGVPCVVYEREESATARLQGGSLDLHWDTGLLALKETDLYDEARGMMRPEGEAMKIVDKTGKHWYDENVESGLGDAPKGGGRPEIDRTDLRNLMLRSLEPDTVKWGHGVKSCRAIDDDTYEVTFLSQPSITTSLLIGADGTFSRVRPLLHQVLPRYTGASMYDMLVPAEAMTPRLQKFVGAGIAFVLDEGKMLLPQMNSGGKCKVYAGLHVEEAWLEEHPLPEKGKKEWVRGLYDGWPEEVRDLIMACDEESLVPRRIYAYDPSLRWKSDMSGVTVIGDAAHVMSPFAGEGVNQALADALDLGQTLVSVLRAPRPSPSLAPFPLSFLPITQPHPANSILRNPAPAELRRALRAFERRMMNRASEEMRSSQENLEICFGPDPARKFRSQFYWMFVRVLWDVTFGYPIKMVRRLGAQ